MISKVSYASRAMSWLGINTLAIIAFDYYANNIILEAHYYAGVTPYWEVNFVLKVILLSFVAYIVSSIPVLNRVVNGRNICQAKNNAQEVR